MPIDNTDASLFDEVNYDSGRCSSTLKLIPLSCDSLPDYPIVETLINVFITKVHIVQRFRRIQDLYMLTCNQWREMQISPGSGTPADMPMMYFEQHPEVAYTPDNTHLHNFYTEEMVYHMRRVLDTLVQLTYIMATPDFISTKILEKDCIGDILSTKIPQNDFEKIILGDDVDFVSDNTNFLSIVNALFNSFKHGFYNEQGYMLFNPIAPSARTFLIKKNLNKKVAFHNHNIHHIMMGFQDAFMRIIGNQKKFLEKYK